MHWFFSFVINFQSLASMEALIALIYWYVFSIKLLHYFNSEIVESENFLKPLCFFDTFVFSIFSWACIILKSVIETKAISRALCCLVLFVFSLSAMEMQLKSKLFHSTLLISSIRQVHRTERLIQNEKITLHILIETQLLLPLSTLAILRVRRYFSVSGWFGW